MAKHLSLAELGLPNSGVTHLAAMDNLNPPPADSINEMTGVATPAKADYQPGMTAKMELNI